jgi:hypothetical protein
MALRLARSERHLLTETDGVWRIEFQYVEPDGTATFLKVPEPGYRNKGWQELVEPFNG